MSGDDRAVERRVGRGFGRSGADVVPSLAQLTWLVVRDVNRTIGGGVASTELMRRSLARRRWLSDDEHGVLVAVGRFTPGTNLLAYCAALGWTCQRAVGAIAAVVAGSLPGALAVTFMAAAIGAIDRWPAVRAILAAAMLVASALVLSSAWALVKPLVLARRGWTVVVAVASAALYWTGATPVRVLLVLAIFGALTPRRNSS